MDRLMIDLVCIIAGLGVGYRIGFRACFEYLTEELEKHKKDLS